MILSRRRRTLIWTGSNRFEEYASKASTENVRDLWARVLSGEIRRPGSFSLATLRLLAVLDKQTATWFQQEAEFRWGAQILRMDKNLAGESLKRLSFLEEMGLIQFVSPVGGVVTKIKSDGPNNTSIIVEGDLCLEIHHNSNIEVPVIPLTHIGHEIATVLPPVVPLEVLRRIGKVVTQPSHQDDNFLCHPPRHGVFAGNSIRSVEVAF